MRTLSGADQQWLFSPRALHQTPSQDEGMTYEQELKRRKTTVEYVRSLAARAQMEWPQGRGVVSVASTLVHRFYMRRSLQDFPEQVIAPTLLFLASKIEEEPCKLRYICNACLAKFDGDEHGSWHPNEENDIPPSREYRRWEKDILSCEEIVLETLCFDMDIEQPWVVLWYATRGLDNLRLPRTSSSFLDNHPTEIPVVKETMEIMIQVPENQQDDIPMVLDPLSAGTTTRPDVSQNTDSIFETLPKSEEDINHTLMEPINNSVKDESGNMKELKREHNDGHEESNGHVQKEKLRATEEIVPEVSWPILNQTSLTPLSVLFPASVIAFAALILVVSIVEEIPLSRAYSWGGEVGWKFHLEVEFDEEVGVKGEDLEIVKQCVESILEYSKQGLLDQNLISFIPPETHSTQKYERNFRSPLKPSISQPRTPYHPTTLKSSPMKEGRETPLVHPSVPDTLMEGIDGTPFISTPLEDQRMERNTFSQVTPIIHNGMENEPDERNYLSVQTPIFSPALPPSSPSLFPSSSHPSRGEPLNEKNEHEEGHSNLLSQQVGERNGQEIEQREESNDGDLFGDDE
ncbi:hypothetical protein M231_05267 [Tremella mesenterica]|uniref:Cyclin-like domain-containing protein n=1 Tax=Tremella mesenterica TaxID=5217 RepID=A0A4Q1BII4_TREME|nr:hypothetical protein M231_05267 [Tremella mesenterica]